MNNIKEIQKVNRIYDDEPNHVTVKIFSNNGKQNVEFTLNGDKSDVEIANHNTAEDIRYFSFASRSTGEKQEYFYNCEE